MTLDEIEGFTIQGEGGDYLKFEFQEVYGFPNSVGPWGGYDVRASLNIKAEGFCVSSSFYTSTGDFFNLYQQFIICNEQVSGSVQFASCEDNLKFTAHYDISGHITIKGTFWKINQCENELHFEIMSDQTYITELVSQMRPLVNKYGGIEGVEKLDVDSVE